MAETKLNPLEQPPMATNQVIEEVEAFVEENEERKRLYFYKSPRLRQFWGDEQEELESWKELFFDLIYVAVAFQLGKVLEELINLNEGFGSVIYFFAQFAPLFGLWYMRMAYLSRFIPTSYFHGILDVIYSLLIALMSVFIATRSEIEESIGKSPSDFSSDDSNITSSFILFAESIKESIGYNTTLGFSVIGLLAAGINLFRSIELISVVRKYGLRDDNIDDKLKYRQKKAIYNQGKFSLIMDICFISLIVLSIIGSIIGDEVLFLLPLCSSFFTIILFYVLVNFVWRKCMGKPRVEIIPINVGFAIKRFGEFSMLMLGEGVLQIIITDVDSDDLTGHFKTFILAFLILSSLFFIIFYGLPLEPEEHAMRKNALAALIIGILNPFMYCSIMGVGVALKLVLKNQAKLDKLEDATVRSTVVFLITVLCIIIVTHLLHFGYYEIFKRDSTTEGKMNRSWGNVYWSRICFSFVWILSPLLMLSVVETDLKGPEFLASLLGFFVIVLSFWVLEKKLFLKEEFEVEEVQGFVVSDEMREKYEKEEMMDMKSNAERSSIRTTKKSNCSVVNMLHYLRSKTKKMDVNVQRAAETGEYDYNWREDLGEIQKIAKLINDTMENYERKLEANNEAVTKDI